MAQIDFLGSRTSLRNKIPCRIVRMLSRHGRTCSPQISQVSRIADRRITHLVNPRSQRRERGRLHHLLQDLSLGHQRVLHMARTTSVNVKISGLRSSRRMLGNRACRVAMGSSHNEVLVSTPTRLRRSRLRAVVQRLISNHPRRASLLPDRQQPQHLRKHNDHAQIPFGRSGAIRQMIRSPLRKPIA